ncbi:MAG: serine hydrolase [Bryobacteraceae bacterium]|nr:MAG: serine hydrolase [Bryobacteraceae bacterium]
MTRPLRLWSAALLPLFALAQPNLDETVERALRTFEVPGAAVLVVKDGQIVTAKGYGVRRLGEPAPVTPRTLFGIASNTKAFTAAAMAMLVDEGKVRWDDRVIDHLPEFQMSDPYVTREMRVRDLFTHRSGLGLGAGDLMYFPPSDLGRAEIVRRLRFVPLAHSFRERYDYDNILYIVAGELISHVSGMSWDDFLRTRIFEPLGMRSTNTSVRAHGAQAEIAYPHARAEGALVALPLADSDNWGAAAGINSCIEDLSRWVRLQLNRGEWAGKRLFSEARHREMWTPVTWIPVRPGEGALAQVAPQWSAYALGWNLSDYRGQRIVHHSGGLAGMVTRTVLVPVLNLGVVVLTNQESGAALNAIVYTVLDHYFGAEAVDWIAVLEENQKKREKEAAAKVSEAMARRNPASRPSLPPSSYAGRYRDAWYGDVLVEERDGRLRIRFSHTPWLEGTLEHFHYDTFVARWDRRWLLADAWVTFSLKPDGSVDGVRMSAISPLTDFSFDFHDLHLRPVPADAKPY